MHMSSDMCQTGFCSIFITVACIHGSVQANCWEGAPACVVIVGGRVEPTDKWLGIGQKIRIGIVSTTCGFRSGNSRQRPSRFVIHAFDHQGSVRGTL
jgi:hypothetical protein